MALGCTVRAFAIRRSTMERPTGISVVAIAYIVIILAYLLLTSTRQAFGLGTTVDSLSPES
jgi:hypothetical protein